MENKCCPLLKEDCKGKSCAWYVIGLNECAVNSIAQTLDNLSDIAEEAKNAD